MNNYIDLPEEGGGSSGVTSLNGQTGALTLVAGTGIVITPGVSTLTISSSGVGFVLAGDVTGPYNANHLTATTNSTLTTLSALSLPYSQVTGAPGGTVTGVTASLPLTSSGGNNPNLTLNYDGTANSTLYLNGSNNLAVQYMSVSTSGSNYYWGYAAGSATTSGFGNQGFGTNALLSVTSGNYNIAIGDLAGEGITTGSSNIAIGGTCLEDVTTTSNNIAIGKSTLRVTTGNNNTAIGFSALNSNTTGGGNTAIGYEAGFNSSGLVTSTNITLLGTNTGNSGSDGITNSTALGFGAQVNASNQIVLGNASVTSIISGTPSVLYNSASPMTTLGDMEYYSAGVQRLNIGTNGQLLTVAGGIPTWQTLSASSISGVITVPNGGTGLSTTSPYAILAGGAVPTSNLQQVSGTGTSGQVLMSNGANTLPTWQNVTATSGANGAQFITSGTTFTTPSTISAATQFKFTLIGGGGGGAGIAATTNNASVGGGGGGVGILSINGLAASTAYIIAIGAAGIGGASGANPGTTGGNTTVTIGAITYVAGGGSGGTTGVSNDGGAGGTCTNTTISITGGAGGSVGVGGTATISGYGGSAPGYGAQTSGHIATGPGNSGTGYGSGGSGAKCATATAEAGGNGAAGAIFVEWFN